MLSKSCSLLRKKPNPIGVQDDGVYPPSHLTGTTAVEKLNLGELLQCGLDLSGEWPNEEEELSLERPSRATLQGTRHKVGTRHEEQHSASPDRPPR